MSLELDDEDDGDPSDKTVALAPERSSSRTSCKADDKFVFLLDSPLFDDIGWSSLMTLRARFALDVLELDFTLDVFALDVFALDVFD